VHASAAATAPYFFLSYAHESRGGVRDDEAEVAYWVGEFFRDLSLSVEQRAGLLKGVSPGFMDRERRAGNDWPTGVVRALGTCRVFVPLYSSRYFADEHCGKEWNYFVRRMSDPTTQEAAIVPGIWDPVQPGMLPLAARAPQFRHRGSEAYEAHGFYGIMKPSRYRKEYAQAVSDLAGRIVTAAERYPVKAGMAVDHGALESAFGRAESAQERPESKRVGITVVALRRDELPAERLNSPCYGPSALDWKPYAPDSVRPIAETAAELARSLGYRAEVGDLYQHEEDLLCGDPSSGPRIVIIDPWALTVPYSQQLLQRLNVRDLPWIQAIVPWNAADEESRKEEGKLRVALDAAFGHKLAEVASTSSMAARGVPSLDDFDEALRQLIWAAAKRYLRNAPAYPPAGKPVERPRIS
jgi:FxsC-like protein